MEKQTKPSVKEIVTYLKLLGSHTTRSFVGLILLYVIGAFLETFSITLILPLVTVFLDPENKTGKMASFVNGIFGDTPLVVLVVMIFLAFLLKNVYLYVLDIVKRKFVIVNYRKTSEKLFALYLNKPYEFYTKVNSATLINNINVYTGKIFVYLQTVVNLISELIVMIVLIIAMCFINWMVALYAIISFSLVTFILKKVLYGRMKAIGVKSNKSFDHMLMSVSQAIAGIKETKTYKVEKDVLDEYNEHLKINADMEVKYTAISAVSSRLIEMVTITGMLIILLVTYVKGLDSTSLIAQLAVFAVVLVRMMPGMSRINVYLSHMNNQHATLERSDGDFKESIKLISKTEDVKADTREKINIDFDKICLDNIYFRYDEDRMILDDINMTINRGDTIGLKGASGEGKTTLLNLLLGLLKPTNGSITFKKGDDAVIENAMIGSLNVGYIPQDVFIFDGTIAENITFFRKYDKEKMAKAIKLAHMEELMEQLEKGENTRIGERGIRLSGGQNQRIGIARALYDNPDVLILDEATSALDNNLENQIMNDIYELKGIKTIIIAAHRLSTLAYCDRVYDIKKGHAVLCDEKFS